MFLAGNFAYIRLIYCQMMSVFKKRIYLDFASITPIDKRVSKEMKRAERFFANPSSLYKEGVVARGLLEKARKSVATLLRAFSDEIFFTSGGTEGNNIAILGTYLAIRDSFKKQNKIPHMIVSSIEHSSVLECAKFLESEGVSVTYLKPNSEGIIETKELKDALKPETFLVSVHFANNEIGTIQPIKEITKQIRHFKKEKNSSLPYFHTDACQVFNFIPIDVNLLHIDLLTLDGSKVYGPRSSGVLFKRRNVEVRNISFGGGQEKNIRSGTENLQNILGLTKALQISDKCRQKETAKQKRLQAYFVSRLKKDFPESVINGSLENRLPNNINFATAGMDSEFAVLQMDFYGIAISSASSCLNNKEDSFSYVVKEINEGAEKSSLRVSFGRTTKISHIDYFFKRLNMIKSIQYKNGKFN